MDINLRKASLPSPAGKLSEEEATEVFRHYRFIDSGGVPYCPKCGSLGVYKFKCRPIYRCRQSECKKQFSLTSGTPFAYKKLSFSNLITLIAKFNHAAHAQTAYNTFVDLEINYKTAFMWLHKLREGLVKATDGIILEGDVEIDGARVGGKNRPPNGRRQSNDVRRSKWRQKHKTVHVTSARQRRGGPIILWVAKEESYAAKEILRRSTESTTFYTDEGNWSSLDERQRFSVNHSETFCTPEASVNLCENFNTMLRYAEQNYKKIGDRYLDFYAAEAAWRTSRGGQPGKSRRSRKGEEELKFASHQYLMKGMFINRRSDLVGYFKHAHEGGVKRLCPIILDTKGTVGKWRQPTAEEWRAIRDGYRSKGEAPPAASIFDTPSLKTARSSKWREQFSYVTAQEFNDNPTLIPDRPGVYSIFVRGGEDIMAALNVEGVDHPLPNWSEAGCLHLYTGESFGIRGRLIEHLLGKGGPSNFRDTLFALQWCAQALPEGPSIMADRGVSEAGLSAWLQTRVIIGYKVCGYTKEHEEAVLQRTSSPLNIKGKETGTLAPRLKEMRQRFRESMAWPPIKKAIMPKRR